MRMLDTGGCWRGLLSDADFYLCICVLAEAWARWIARCGWRRVGGTHTGRDRGASGLLSHGDVFSGANAGLARGDGST